MIPEPQAQQMVMAAVPDTGVAVEDGFEAYVMGFERCANPYCLGLPEHTAWDNGWELARDYHGR
jgi:hypothetical protein